MQPRSRHGIWAALLIGIGLVLLVYNLGWLAPWALWIVYGLAGVCALAALVVAVMGNRSGNGEWWRVIPPWSLFSLAIALLILAVPAVPAGMAWPWATTAVLAGQMAAFFHVYRTNPRERWWALIPAGFLLVLSVMQWAATVIVSSDLLTALLFIGLGLVFCTLVPAVPGARQWWALLPASVLILWGGVLLRSAITADAWLVNLWPLLLIAAGLFVAAWRTSSSVSNKLPIHAAPKLRAAPPAAATGSEARAALGDYQQPAPGASVQLIVDE